MSDTVLQQARQIAPSYGPVPFWSWNDRLDPQELRRQIRAMHKIGMHGFFMHARFGLETEYMSDEWFDCIQACIDEAKKLGMDAWSYDENGWPSGFAGGALLHDEDNFARYLVGAVEDTYPTGDDVRGVYIIKEDSCRTAEPGDSAPYYVVRERADSSYVDVLRADITEKFIAETHEKYKERLGADLGKTMPGFFTDEPQYYRYAQPYSRALPQAFAEKYGYPIDRALAALFWDFDGAIPLRYDYWLLVHECFIHHFIQPIYDWCEKNGCQLTGHGIEETSLAGQMVCCGGLMEFYCYEHIPGIDHLGRGIGHPQDLSSKQLGSVCAQTGRNKALSETFACCGWDVSPRELKRIAELQYAGGVNLMCQHLYPYSARGQRKRDYPAHYSEHSPWHSRMAEFDRHFANLGAFLGLGEELASTLVIHPIRAAYRTFQRTVGNASVAPLDQSLRRLVATLAEKQIPYHFGDEGMMETMAAVEGTQLRVGKCVYDYVIVPEMETLSANTAALLRAFQKNGGKLCFIGDVPHEIDARAADLSDLTSAITLEEIAAAAPVAVTKDGANVPQLRQRIRVSEGRRVIFTTNVTAEDVRGVRMVIRGCAGTEGVSTDTMETFPLRGERLPDGSLSLLLDFADAESIVILETAGASLLAPVPTVANAPITLPEKFTLSAPLTNALTLDHACVSKDGGKTWTEPRPIECVRDNLLADRYEGDVCLRYPFTVADVPGTAEIVWENASVLGVTVNGHAVTADGILAPDAAFSRADVHTLLRRGENDITLTLHYFQRQLVYDVLFGNVMESLRNCLTFDTEVECVYVRGDFRIGVDREKCTDGVRSTVEYTGDFPIVAPRAAIELHDMVRDGLPFYGGAVEAETVIDWHAGDGTVFAPAGRFAACDVWVNGESAGSIFFASSLDLAPYLREGENTIRLRVTNALRNTMGPHHRADPEPYGVSPTTFSFEKEWHGTDCPAYCPRYAFVKFGI